MVDVRSTNAKLIDRARRIFRAVLTPILDTDPSIQPSIDVNDDEMVDRLIRSCEGSVKIALVVARWTCKVDEAKTRLDRVDGILRRALER